MNFRKKKQNTIFIKAFILSLFLFGSNQVFSQKERTPDTTCSQKPSKSKFGIGAEYLAPTKYNDKIQTVSMHAVFWKQYFKNISILINPGITTTYAWGYTADLTLNAGAGGETNHKTSAFGIGPVLQLDYAPIHIKRFSVVIEASGGFILYSNRFPYGGDIYNFMFRAGPSIAYKIAPNYFVKTGYLWMHVSNGKGMGPQNPYYEAHGITLSLVIVK